MNLHAIAEPLQGRHSGLSARYCLDPLPILERQAARESNARTYPRRIPLALQRARGIYVEDTRGQVFIDCLAGAGTLALGHNHPAVVEAIQDALRAGLPLHTLDLTTPVKDRFVQMLYDMLPPEFGRAARIQFCGPTGADAIEASLKIARTATARHGTLSFQGGYHGTTLGTLSISGNLHPKARLGALLPGAHLAPYPHDYRCPFGLGGEAGIDANLHYLRQLLSDPEGGVTRPGAIVLEAVQGEGGVIPAPARWLQGVRQLARELEIPLVLDEIQCGIGRTGRMFAFEHAGVLPDILPLSKAIGGGLPLAVVVYRDALDVWEPGAHAGTFRGNQLAMAAGCATLRVMASEGLVAHAAGAGGRLRRHLDALRDAFAWIGDVRGRGLMLGIEIVDPAGAPDGMGRPPASGALARRYQRACLERGLILETGGRWGATLRLLPPLIVTDAQIDHIAEILQHAAPEVALA